MIPQRFVVHCVFCNAPLDMRQDGVFQLTSGWVKNRSQGGGNAIALAERQPHWACPHCIDSKINGPKPLTLFG